MTLRQSLYVMRRWRSVIVAGVLIGIVVGWLSAGGAPVRRPTFEATQTLIVVPGSDGLAVLKRVQPIATLGGVPTRVAARLGLDRRIVQARVFIQIPPNKGVVLITGRSSDRARAEALANVTAEEAVAEFGGPAAPFRALEPAVATEVPREGVDPPRSRPARALMLGAFGLVLGIAGAFAVERFDTRIRSRHSAEDALGVPVVAEIPVIARADRDRLLTGAQPSGVIEAYRSLRTTVERWTPPTADVGGGRILAVTSPVGDEGTTTTAAHLAATLGEIGRSVVVISANIHQPQLHSYFGRAQEPGLTDVLRGAPDARRLSDLNTATAVRGVRLVASGSTVRNLSPLLEHVGGHLHEARSLAEFVLIDAPPLLTASEAADFARHADGVLLVVRAGRTGVGAAARAAELLRRLDVPVLGAVLVDSDGLGGRTYTRGSKRSGSGD